MIASAPAPAAPRPLRYPGVPLAMLLACGAVLALLWRRAPLRWPVNWDVHGVANRWANRSLLALLAPLLIGFAFCGFLALCEGLLERSPLYRRAALAPIYQASCWFLRTLALGIALLSTLLAITLPFPLVHPLTASVIGLCVLSAGMGFGVSRMARAFRGVARGEHAHEVAGYTWYGTYSNCNDPRLIVRRLSGAGWTINFAHRRAPLAAILFFLPGLVTTAVTVAHALRHR
jgi:uncharacterized membrane protein